MTVPTLFPFYIYMLKKQKQPPASEEASREMSPQLSLVGLCLSKHHLIVRKKFTISSHLGKFSTTTRGRHPATPHLTRLAERRRERRQQASLT